MKQCTDAKENWKHRIADIKVVISAGKIVMTAERRTPPKAPPHV